MERTVGRGIPQKDDEKNQRVQIIHPETPRINGSKPTENLRIQEQCKKHIRRDGRK